jgi:hypothetical protein
MNQSGDLGQMRSEISFASGLDRSNQSEIARQLSLYAQRLCAPFEAICSCVQLNVRMFQGGSGKCSRFPVVWSSIRGLSAGDKSGNTADHTCPPIRQRRKLGAARIRAGMRAGSKGGGTNGSKFWNASTDQAGISRLALAAPADRLCPGRRHRHRGASAALVTRTSHDGDGQPAERNAPAALAQQRLSQPQY